jgi:zinc protease
VANSVLYGPEHPFGRVLTEASLSALTLDECKAYVAAALKPQGARLFVAGDMTRKQVEQRFGKAAIAGWTGKAPALPALPAPKPRPGRIFFVHLAGAEQSQVHVMHFGPRRKAADYFANTLAGQVLGGGFAGRINMNLREDKGYSYGARGGFDYSRRYGELNAAASVRTDSTWQSTMELWTDLTTLQNGKRPPTADELGRERNGNILALPARFATMSGVLGAYRELVYYGLPMDYFKTFIARMSAVTLGQVAASARTHLDPAKAQVLVVGDGAAPQKRRVVKEGKKLDEPMVGADGKPVTLLDSLKQMVAKGGPLAGGELVILDADGNVLPQ